MPKVPVKKPKFRALGITCGIGSMLVGARQAGFEVVGNIEWRKYYHAKDDQGWNTFTENFPGAFMKFSVDDLTDDERDLVSNCDIVLGHPECGNFSNLGGSNKDRGERMKDPCDIPLFVDLVNRVHPRFFVMDDLPKSFGAFSMAEYSARLPDYDLYPEWVSNWGYGNIQKNRNRMFMIGSLRSERWVFIPGEEDHDRTVKDSIGDLLSEKSYPNQDPHELDTSSGRFINMPRYGDRLTWRQFADYIRDGVPEGVNFPYERADGSAKVRIGSCKIRWEGASAVLHGGNPILHPVRCLPLTIRERARIQGFPDDFIFYGTKFDDAGQWNHEKNLHMIKQTGKAMPVQFCRYVSKQVMAHVAGLPFESSGERIIKTNPDVDRAKQWFCREVGYSEQEKACDQCWLRSRCSIRTDKYGIGLATPPVVPVPRKTLMKKIAEVAEVEPLKAEKAPMIRMSNPAPIRVETIVGKGPPRIPPPEPVHVVEQVPEDYHCSCRFCANVIGELIRPDGTNYSRLDRRAYYDPSEKGQGGHIAKTPLHVARWAVQEYTEPGGWVLDPTAGAGTTIVEALIQGRNAAGVELEYHDVILANVRRAVSGGLKALVGLGDARSIEKFLVGRQFNLVQNNPPYFGDQNFPSPSKEGYGPEFRHLEKRFLYDKDLPNLGLLKEGPEYWDWITRIYRSCTDNLVVGGRFVVAVKDQMRNKKPDQLHERLAEVLEGIGLVHEGTAFLRHHPTTLHLNTYFKRYRVHPPYFQTILVFRKEL